MVAIIGANGQLGVELCKSCGTLGLGYYAISHSNIRVEDTTSVNNCLNDLPYKPDVVINTAAFHNVDKCESAPSLAFAVNAEGSANVAMWCRDNGVKYCFVSTDYCHAEPTDQSGFPLNVYGKTKLAGELAALSICPDALVARVAGLYGASGCRAKNGGNFINTVAEKIKQQEPFTLPDYTSVLWTSAKEASLRILKNLDKSGVWYGTDTCTGTSPYKMGCRIADYLNLPNKIQAISFDPNDTIRPHKTEVRKVGHNYRWLALSIMDIGPCYSDPLDEYLREKGYIK